MPTRLLKAFYHFNFVNSGKNYLRFYRPYYDILVPAIFLPGNLFYYHLANKVVLNSRTFFN